MCWCHIEVDFVFTGTPGEKIGGLGCISHVPKDYYYHPLVMSLVPPALCPSQGTPPLPPSQEGHTLRPHKDLFGGHLYQTTTVTP